MSPLNRPFVCIVALLFFNATTLAPALTLAQELKQPGQRHFESSDPGWLRWGDLTPEQQQRYAERERVAEERRLAAQRRVAAREAHELLMLGDLGGAFARYEDQRDAEARAEREHQENLQRGRDAQRTEGEAREPGAAREPVTDEEKLAVRRALDLRLKEKMHALVGDSILELEQSFRYAEVTLGSGFEYVSFGFSELHEAMPALRQNAVEVRRNKLRIEAIDSILAEGGLGSFEVEYLETLRAAALERAMQAAHNISTSLTATPLGFGCDVLIWFVVVLKLGRLTYQLARGTLGRGAARASATSGEAVGASAAGEGTSSVVAAGESALGRTPDTLLDSGRFLHGKGTATLPADEAGKQVMDKLGRMRDYFNNCRFDTSAEGQKALQALATQLERLIEGKALDPALDAVIHAYLKTRRAAPSFFVPFLPPSTLPFDLSTDEGRSDAQTWVDVGESGAQPVDDVLQYLDPWRVHMGASALAPAAAPEPEAPASLPYHPLSPTWELPPPSAVPAPRLPPIELPTADVGVAPVDSSAAQAAPAFGFDAPQRRPSAPVTEPPAPSAEAPSARSLGAGLVVPPAGPSSARVGTPDVRMPSTQPASGGARPDIEAGRVDDLRVGADLPASAPARRGGARGW